MQDEGLPAGGFEPVADLDAAAVETVLGALARAGIEAYVRPGADARPGRELVRLWVEAAAASDARTVLRSLGGTSADAGPEPDAPPSQSAEATPAEPVDDAAWAQIVADFHASPDTDLGTERGAVPADDRDPDEGAPRPGRVLRAVQPEVEPVGPAGPDLREPGGEPEPWHPSELAPQPAAREAEEHFVPPAPPPLPRGDTVSRFAWAGVLGGPTYLLLALLVGWEIPPLLGAGAVGAFVAGFGTLVVRMGGDDDRDDNGAVV